MTNVKHITLKLKVTMYHSFHNNDYKQAQCT